MPSTIYWTDGGADGDMANLANYSGGAYPVNGDTFIIAQGYTSIQTSLSQLSGVTLAKFQVTEGFKGQYIGDENTALTTSTVTSFLFKGHPGLVFAKFSAPVTKATVDSTGAGSFQMTGGTWATFQACGQGLIIVGASATITTLKLGGPTRMIARSGTGFTTVEIGAGARLDTYRDIVNGGTGHSDGEISFLGASSLAGTATLKLSGRGICRFQSTAATQNSVEAKGLSKVDPTGSPRDFTLSTLIRWRGSNIVRKAGGITMTITSEEPLGGDDPLLLAA